MTKIIEKYKELNESCKKIYNSFELNTRYMGIEGTHAKDGFVKKFVKMNQ